VGLSPAQVPQGLAPPYLPGIALATTGKLLPRAGDL